jgi:putative endopeptidase
MVMNKKGFLFLTAGLTFLLGCQAPQSPDETAVYSDPLDLAAQDSSVKPQQNFYMFANGSWLEKTVIPPSQFAWGSFSTLLDTNLNRMRGILDSLSALRDASKGSLAQQTGDFYTSGMDSAGIQQKGYQPVRSELDSIAAIQTTAALYHEIAREYTINHKPFFSFYVNADDRNSRMNIVHFDQGGLGLPSRDYYFKTDSSSQKIREAYKQYIRSVLSMTGQSPDEASKAAANIFQLETQMAKISRSPVELRDPVKNYNKMVIASHPDLKNWLVYFGIKTDTVLVGQPDFFKGLMPLLATTPMETLKAYLRFHVMDDDADYLSQDFVDARFGFNKLLTGQTVMKERWKRMTTLTDQQLGDNLGQVYVAKYFTPADKKRIGEMVDNIMIVFENRINQLDWMSDSTKKKAMVKLHAIVKKIAYPDKWKDYSSVTISRDNLVANIRQTANFKYREQIEKIGKPVDRTEWQMTPPTVNAYYEPTQNNINFPAGILQPPFYFANGDDAVNYGGIGLVIGHEITHGFDDQGRLYDANGDLREWWNAEDSKKFTARARNIVKQFDGYIAIDTMHANGSLTEGENIADLGGLTLAYEAFKKTEQGNRNEKISGFTADQRFFLSHAQVWRTKLRPERIKLLTMTNPHSIPQWRVNGPLSNMPAFYAAFQVQPSDSMYRPDSLRVKIW